MTVTEARTPASPAPTPKRRWSRRSKVASGVIGVLLAGGGAFAATNWTVGLAGGSSGEAQSGTVSNLIITAVATPAATHLLYPGTNGDVVLTIQNPNPFNVTVTAVDLPTNTTYAAGYTTSALSVAQAGCDNTLSDVIWNYSTASDNTSHTLTTPITVTANTTLTVTMTNDASMTTGSPAACENTFFKMASLDGVSATVALSTDTPTTGPALDAWTS